MEDSKCFRLSLLAAATASLIRTDLRSLTTYSALVQQLGGPPGTAQPSPTFSHTLVKEAISILEREHFLFSGHVSSDGLLRGSYNNIDFAMKQIGIALTQRGPSHGEPIKTAIGALEGAALALEDIAKASLVQCLVEAGD